MKPTSSGRLWCIFWSLCVVVGIGCSTPVTGGGSGVPACVPGKVTECPCSGGGKSTQTCGSTGAWGACLCSDASVSETSSADSGSEINSEISSADADISSSDDDSGGFTDDDSGSGCGTCGYGAVKGLLCSPNDKNFVAGASVTVDYTDCDGSKKQANTTTGADGSYAFPKLPCGSQHIVVTAGQFSEEFDVAISSGQTSDLTASGKRQCFGSSAKIAVFWGQWDEQNGILDKLGFTYTYYNYKADFDANTPPKDIEACKVLRDLNQLKAYKILFFNCGSEVKEWMADYPEITQNLKNFVLQGGSIYASDLAWPTIEGPFPDAIDFYGSIDWPKVPSNDGPQVVAANQTAPAQIQTALLATYAGTLTFNAKYGTGPLIAVQAAGQGTTVHVNTTVKIENPAYSKGGFPPPPEFLSFKGPAVLSYQPPGIPGAGRVVYTTFHNDDQADALMQKILNYLVFLL